MARLQLLHPLSVFAASPQRPRLHVSSGSDWRIWSAYSLLRELRAQGGPMARILGGVPVLA